MKVNFLIIGAARSATTSLSSILAAHPSISFSKPKEPQFFSKEEWRDSLDDYHKLFKKKKGVLYGEGSTNYTKYPFFNTDICNDIFEYNSDMKLIYIIRNPLERIKSHYKFALERGYTDDSINGAIKSNSIYLETSKYYKQIIPYINTFGLSKVKIFLFEDFTGDPQKVIDDICAFLNINTMDLSDKKTHFNQSKKGKIGSIKYDNPKNLWDYFKKIYHYIKRNQVKTKSSNLVEDVSDATLNTIKKSLNDDIEKLEILLKRDLTTWKI